MPRSYKVIAHVSTKPKTPHLGSHLFLVVYVVTGVSCCMPCLEACLQHLQGLLAKLVVLLLQSQMRLELVDDLHMSCQDLCKSLAQTHAVLSV